MFKKLTTACLALVALAAFAIPASASAASPSLTDSTGTLVTVGTGLKATNIGATKFKGSFGEVSCSSAVLTGPLSKNAGNGEAIEGTIENASFTGTSGTGTQCSSTLGAVTVTTNVGNGTPWCVRALPGAGDELQTRGGACSEKARSITYVLDFSGMTCHYERTTATGPVKGTYTTAPEDARGKIATGANSEFVRESGDSIFCPANGSLEMEFELKTSTGGTLTIS